jgi:hypothetical protein
MSIAENAVRVKSFAERPTEIVEHLSASVAAALDQSLPILINRKTCAATVVPGTGATAKVQFSTSPLAVFQADSTGASASWEDSAEGAVTAVKTSQLSNVTAVRVNVTVAGSTPTKIQVVQ